MDEEEQAIVEEYASSLEDLTFNSKPLINVLTMLAEENSRYASSVTKLIEERIYKVSQQHKLPSLYLLDSIIKNVGGIYLNLIAQVLVKVFVAVFGKGDEKTRKDLYKLRHTWPQYFSAKVLHDLDVNINKLDPGWPITAVPPPSPSIHVNPKFLQRAEATVTIPPKIPTILPEVSKEEEKQVLLEHQKRLAELQRLQEEQLRLTEQEIQEHQLKRDLILKKQEQERKALLTQQQKMLLDIRLESEGELFNSGEKTSLKSVSTKAELTPPTHSITSSRDPRLQRQEQAPSNNNNKASQQQRHKDNELRHTPAIDPRDRDIAKFSKDNQNKNRTETVSNNKRRSRSQSPVNEKAKKFPRHDGHLKDRDSRPESEKFQREERPPKRRRSLDGTDIVGGKKKDFLDRQGSGEHRGYWGRGDRGRGVRGGRGRGRIGGKPNRDEHGIHKGPRSRAEDPRQRLHPEGRNSPHIQSKDNLPEKVPDLVKPKPLLSKEEVQEIRAKDSVPENATIPQELTLEHKSIILEEAKRRLEAGLISQEQYIELIDKLAEFYELQRQQELEVVSEIPAQIVVEKPEQVHGPPNVDPRNQNGRGERPGRLSRNRRPNEGNRHALLGDGPGRNDQRILRDPRRRDGLPVASRPSPPRVNISSPPRVSQPSSVMEGPPIPSRLPRIEDHRRDLPHGVRVEGALVQRVPHPPEHLQPRPLLNLDHHPPDQGPSVRFLPSNNDNRELRGPGPHQQHIEEPHFRGEILVDSRGHPLQELPSFGHGRPVDHFQGQPPGHHGPPVGPGHEVPPHIRTTQAGGLVQHIGEPSLNPGQHPRELPLHRHLEPVHLGQHLSEHSIHHLPHPGEPIQHPAQHPGQRPGQPGHHPGIPPVHSGFHPGLRSSEHSLHQAEELGLSGHHPDEVRSQGVVLGPGGSIGPGGPPTMHLHMTSQGSPHRQDTNTPPPSIPAQTPPTPSRMDKKTVDDLFSRLVQVGIIQVAEEPMSNTPPRIGTPPNMMTQPIMNPHPAMQQTLPPSSIAPTIPKQPPPTSQAPTMTPLNLQKLHEMLAKSKEATTIIPKLELNTNDLKRKHPGIISMLYKGTQCSSCGLRFDGEAEAFYREHLDWHFRRNRREKDGKRIAHRQWYITLKDWLEYEEITDPEEKAHSSFFDAVKTDSDTNTPKIQDSEGSCPVLPDDTETENVCDICQEKFEQFWEETREEWHYKEAIRVDGKTYHGMCYQDAKSNVEETATEAIVDNSETEQEPDKSPTEEKTENPEVKAQDDGEAAQVPIVKKEESLSTEVKTEDGSKAQCGASVQSNDEVSKQTDVPINESKVKIEAMNESKVKIEPTENDESLINTGQNKSDTNSDGDKSCTANM